MFSLHQQFKQVHQLQQKLKHYHSLYTNPTQDKEEQENQFLPQSETQSEAEKDPICVSQLVEGQGEAGLSRIFEDIVLGEEVIKEGENNFEIVLQLEGQSLPLKFRQGQDKYSLSNFSSFNTCTPKNDSTPEFSELLQAIQQETSKTLTKSAVNSIISQIKLASSQLQSQESSIYNAETCKVSTLTDDFIADLQETKVHQQKGQLFDSILNNIPFQRKKGYESGGISKNMILSHNEPSSKQSRRDKIGRKNVGLGKRDKENRSQKMMKSSNLAVNIKILGRGKELMCHYTDQKSLEHFCILNKILGKDKDKLVRAIHSGKTILNLE